MRRRSNAITVKQQSWWELMSCLLLPLLLTCVGVGVGVVEGRKNHQAISCSSSSCGRLRDIRYPFRLQSDPPRCGSPDYELLCDGGNPTLEWESGRYYVTGISYENKTVSVVDPAFVNDDCPLPRQSPPPYSVWFFDYGTIDGTSLCGGGRVVGFGMPGDLYGTTDPYGANGFCDPPPSAKLYFIVGGNYWALFVNCTTPIGDDDDAYQRIPCLSNNNAFVYAVVRTGAFVVGEIEPSCEFLASIPLPGTDGRAPNKTADIFELLKEGFLLSWDVGREPRSTMISNYCLRQAKSLFSCNCNDLINLLAPGIGLFSRIREAKFADLTNGTEGILSVPYSLVKSEVYFLSCMNYMLNSNHYFRYAVALVVVIGIVQLLPVLWLLGRFVFMPISLFILLAYNLWSSRVSIDIVEKFLRDQQSLSPTRYSYTDIIAITGHFREKLGQGGFGSVFRGTLLSSQHVAVKMLGNPQFNGEEFINEVSTIGRIHHVNIVRLVGFCSEGSKRALVYEYMPNGSLDKYIFSARGTSNRPFSWDKLNEIALGVARGIDYLHRGCDMQILHFDIKPHNILLDQNFNPKVSDFGLAKLYPKDYSLVSLSAARGTVGYIAPELVSRNFGIVSDKSDVYSFGMLLLEMAGGRRNVDRMMENTSQVYYPSWIYDQLTQSEGIGINNNINIHEVERKLCKVGLWCIQMKSSNRPSMDKVVEMLEGNTDNLQMPSRPFFSSSQPTSTMQSSMQSGSIELSIISEQEDLSNSDESSHLTSPRKSSMQSTSIEIIDHF